MVDDKNLRDAMHTMKYNAQFGAMPQESVELVLDELAKKLRMKPVSLKPMYQFNAKGTLDYQHPHIKSYMSGRIYDVREPRVIEVRCGGVGGKRYEARDEEAAIRIVQNYEIERGIVRQGVSD